MNHDDDDDDDAEPRDLDSKKEDAHHRLDTFGLHMENTYIRTTWWYTPLHATWNTAVKQ